jgi:hypothetical protein
MQNQLNQIYQRIKQSNPGMDDDQARRNAWVMRDRLLFENTVLATSTSPAAGAGAGGGGNRTPQSTEFPIITAEHWCVTWADVLTDTWKIVVYNYTSGILSDVIDTGLVYDSSNKWYLWSDQRAVSERGHSIVFQNNEDSKFKIVFFNSNGTVIATKDFDTQDDFQYTENAEIFSGILNGVRTVYHFDGANVWTHEFPGVGDIEVDDASDDDVMMDGSVLIEAPNNEKWFIARPGGSLVEITQDMIGVNSHRISYNSDFILKIDTDTHIKIISQTGVLKNTFDLTPYLTTSINSSSFYGDNCARILMNSSDGYRLLVSYDSDDNRFVSFTFSNTLNISLDAAEIDWYNPKPSFGKTLIFYSNTSNVGGSVGLDGQDFEIKWLPKGASDFLSHSFGSGTVSFIDGIGNFTGDRTFSLGENPITMFAYPNEEIQVGFLTSGGFVTQSTGILLGSCSNIWGKPMGEKSFAVFDVGSDRIWQVYGVDSIEAQTTTSNSWEWGSSNTDVHRNGTLAVLDSAVGSQSFIYTTEIGLTAGPTSLGDIWNDVDSGNRTGISTEYQVITEFMPGGEYSSFVGGFYLLSRSGLSDYQNCFAGLSPSINYTLNQAKIGTDLISLFFLEEGSSNHRVLNYKTSTLELIDDFNPGNNLSNISLYKNRCRIYEQDGLTYSVRFVGSKGVETIILQANSLNTESNDVNDNG